MAVLGTKKVSASTRPVESAPDSASRKDGLPFHNFFNFSRVQTPGKSVTGILEKPVLKDPRSNVPKADPAVVKSWVAMEEKIVHDHKALPVQKFVEKTGSARPSVPSSEVRKGLNQPPVSGSQRKVSKTDLRENRSWVAMEEKVIHVPGDRRGSGAGEKKFHKITIVGPKVKTASGPSTPKGKALSGGFFSFFRSQPKRNLEALAKEAKQGVVQGPPLDLSKVNVAAVKKWVALEEQVVEDPKVVTRVRPQDAGSSLTAPAKKMVAVPENVKIQAALLLERESLGVQEPLRDTGRFSFTLERLLWVAGWLVAVAFAFLCVQVIVANRQAEQKVARSEHEKQKLEDSYAALKSTSDDQTAELIWLRSQLQDMTWELKETKSEMVALRNTVRTKDEIVRALKAQSEALEKIIAQSQVEASSDPSRASASQNQYASAEFFGVRGVVTSINDQQGFIVVNTGSSQGVHSGQWIMVARGEEELAVGRVDRVYPTMSVVMLRDKKMFQMIREGDSVLFS